MWQTILYRSGRTRMNAKKILVVEDDLALSAGLCFELDTSGYLTVAAYGCQKARYFLENEHFDLVILDVNLPDGNGSDLCREIKAARPELPVIFLTANDLEEDILNGFDLGADDYITKPFHTQILKRRAEVALRRGNSGAKAAMDGYDDGFLRLDFQALTAVRSGEKLSITPNEYKLLRVLTANAGNLVTVTMNRLRAKIEEEGHTYIRTVRGMGYIWTGAGK